ncbi:hypothetical protein MTR67_012719 [Solanum verrucosum]|uniref:Disease resistance RPP13-like protein 1 n=1 Tax=Solanum verrucosum TaxID=315347 RepID=A0AAF0Q943_SOLVR|nr:hypothetical protein MTR67_012719 [Solanum verrucosum]
MEAGLAVGGAFLSSALNVLFDRLAPQGELLKMFRKHKYHAQLFKKLEDILVGLQIVLSDVENKQASNRHMTHWFNKLQSAVDGTENLIEQDKLEETIETLEVLEKQIGRLGLKEHFSTTNQETRRLSTSLVEELDIFVSIVGMGGVGKTTLAKAVYNDENVNDHFGLKAWFCVSEAYDAFRITKGLLQEIGSFDF